MEHTGKRALVLAGGGAKGSYQIGVWHALQALDWTPDIITGASVGTLNGCLFTMGKAREAEELWRSLEIHDVLEVPESLKREELRAFFLDIFRSGRRAAFRHSFRPCHDGAWQPAQRAMPDRGYPQGTAQGLYAGVQRLLPCPAPAGN